MLKVRLNSAAQVTKDTLISQLKTLGCSYQISSDKKTIAFGYGPDIKKALIVLTYTFQTGTCALAYNTTPIQNIRVDQLESTVIKQQDSLVKGFKSITKLAQWLARTGTSEAALLLT
jgi:hypothetical protein